MLIGLPIADFLVGGLALFPGHLVAHLHVHLHVQPVLDGLAGCGVPGAAPEPVLGPMVELSQGSRSSLCLRQTGPRMKLIYGMLLPHSAVPLGVW